MSWYVLRSATRQEPRAVQSLRELGLDAYCPMRTVWNRTARVRTRKVIALFPGYIFVDAPDERGVYGLQEADGVHGFIWVGAGALRRPAVVAGRCVEELRSAEGAGAFDETKPKPVWRPENGTVARITGGPFTGWIGEVIVAKGAEKIQVLLSKFGKVSVKLHQVEAVA